jgi:hypothetical protein
MWLTNLGFRCIPSPINSGEFYGDMVLYGVGDDIDDNRRSGNGWQFLLQTLQRKGFVNMLQKRVPTFSGNWQLVSGNFPVSAENTLIYNNTSHFAHCCAENPPCILHGIGRRSAVKISVFPSMSRIVLH